MAWHRLVRSLECSVLLAVLMVSSLASWLNVLIVFMVIVSSLVFSLVIAQSCHLRFTDRSGLFIRGRTLVSLTSLVFTGQDCSLVRPFSSSDHTVLDPAVVVIV